MYIFSKIYAWKTCILLLTLGMVSIALGASQLNDISNGKASNSYLSMPLPVVLHIAFGIIFNLLAPFQFVATLRERYPKLHRLMGRFLVISAIFVTLSALWMNHYYPSYGGLLKYSGIVAYNVILLGSLYFAIKNVLQRNIPKHRKWMIRAVAVSLAPATQRVIIIPMYIFWGEKVNTDLVIGLLIWSGLLINLAFVEFTAIKRK